MTDETKTANDETKALKQRYRISYKELLRMKISKEAREELIANGIAEPDPLMKRIDEIPSHIIERDRESIADLFELADAINGNVEPDGIKIVVQIRTTKKAEPAPAPEMPF